MPEALAPIEQQLVAAVRRLPPALKRLIAQGVLPPREQELLEDFRALTVRERTHIRATIARFAGRPGPVKGGA